MLSPAVTVRKISLMEPTNHESPPGAPIKCDKPTYRSVWTKAKVQVLCASPLECHHALLTLFYLFKLCTTSHFSTYGPQKIV